MQTSRTTRSVLDFNTEDELRKALMSFNLEDNDTEMAVSEESNDEEARDKTLDWILPVVDPETTEVQSMKQEIRRLLVLKSYDILDSERQVAFDRITGMASRVFKMPVAIITLIDLGRQWWLSNRGLVQGVDMPRKHSLCSHAVLSKKNKVLIVPDASKDFRFKDNPAVAGEPHLRFYAGAPLVSPEGYNLGALCVVDFEPRPPGFFTEEDQATLVDMAQMAMDAMVHRRQAKQREANPARLVAYTAHDLMTPLSGVQLSLSLLAADEEITEKLSVQQTELLTTATSCSELMTRICKSATEAVEDGENSELGLDPDMLEPSTSYILPVTKTDELIKSLRMLTGPIPKQAPVIIRIDPSVPPLILCDDLKLFRAALNLLSSAIHRTQHGAVQLRIFPSGSKAELIFEFVDSADDIPVEAYPFLFKPCKREDGSLRMCLSSVASLIAALDGECGFRPRSDGAIAKPGLRSRLTTGSVFWFSVPLFAPESLGAVGLQFPRKTGPFTNAEPLKTQGVPGNKSTSPWNGYPTNPLRHQEYHDRDVTMSTSRNTGDITGRLSSSANAHGALKQIEVPYNSDAQSPSRSNRIRKALVVDDSLVIRKSLSIALSKMGYEVRQAANGWEAITQMKETVFDIVLCELIMPMMDGFDCVRQLREWERLNRPSPRQIIIGMSSHAGPDAVSQGLKAGMDDFQAKPITVRNLAEIQEHTDVVSHAKVLDVMFELEQGPGSSGNTSEACESDDVCSRKRETDDEESSTMTGTDDDTESGKKRQRTGVLQRKAVAAQRVCLVATDRPSITPSEAFRELERAQWKVVVVHDGNDAVRLLQMRIWDLVLIDDDLEDVGSAQRIGQFREWERENRAARQRNIVLVCDTEIPPPYDKHSFVQAPTGFNHVLGKPIAWEDVKYVLKTSGASEMSAAGTGRTS